MSAIWKAFETHQVLAVAPPRSRPVIRSGCIGSSSPPITSVGHCDAAEGRHSMSKSRASPRPPRAAENHCSTSWRTIARLASRPRRAACVCSAASPGGAIRRSWPRPASPSFLEEAPPRERADLWSRRTARTIRRAFQDSEPPFASALIRISLPGCEGCRVAYAIATMPPNDTPSTIGFSIPERVAEGADVVAPLRQRPALLRTGIAPPIAAMIEIDHLCDVGQSRADRLVDRVVEAWPAMEEQECRPLAHTPAHRVTSLAPSTSKNSRTPLTRTCIAIPRRPTRRRC